MRSLRLQSATEYLMTYGWAILIIAVVLGALFQLGVFNASTFAPRAPPGACQVFRPNGPGSTTNVNLEGICNGELPQYVGYFSNSIGSGISVANLNYYSGVTYTLVVWIKVPQAFSNSGWSDLTWYNGGGFRFNLLFNSCFGPVTFYRNSSNIQAGTGVCLPNSDANVWLFWAGTYNGTNINSYVNGALVANTPIKGTMTDQAQFQLLPDSVPVTYFANLQAYNTSLTTTEIYALYREGIGGAPIKPQNLVGWWPLNGNANDYSGNNNNGAPTNVVFTNQWLSGYTPP